MNLIDRDYLIENINNWKNTLTDDKSKELLTEVIHCIKAKNTIVDIQKLIDGINYQKIELGEEDGLYQEDIQSAVIYNGAIDDALKEVKEAVNHDFTDAFVWDKTPEDIAKEYIREIEDSER